MSSARFSRRVFQKHLGTPRGSMFLKTQGMSGRNIASGHAVYNYTNQNDTFAKYDAFRERRLILVTLSESKWRSMKLELEAASCAPCVNCSPPPLCNVWQSDSCCKPVPDLKAIDIQGTLSPDFSQSAILIGLCHSAVGQPRPVPAVGLLDSIFWGPEKTSKILLQRSKIRHSLECRSYVGAL